jgi:hypothetical protein
MKNILSITGVLTVLIMVAACKKDMDFNRDNTTPTGVGYAPVSANPIQDITMNPPKALSTSSGAATAYAAGATFKVELTFFSQSPVKETMLSQTIAGTKTAVATIPYAPAFSKNKDSDTLLVPYTIPAVASGTVIRLDYQITNVNSLNIVRTVYVKAQ